MPLPHINVLLVRHDRTLQGVYANDGGYIRFVTASAPSQLNQTGTRHWSWATKGLGLSPTMDNNHGIALTLNDPLDHYMYDRPYKKGTVWNPDARRWETPSGDEVKQLTPLNAVEDQTDQLSPVDGIIENDPGNGEWDGDQRVADVNNWGYGRGSVMLSPFDVDGDGYVELPFVSKALDADPNSKIEGLESSKAEVLQHTITHEIAHAIAVPFHTDVNQDLMYKYSTNWERADYLSDWFRSLLKISNKNRF
jgi:hypothetical protein